MNLLYRYTLTRSVDDLNLRAGGRLLWVMMNPSTADEHLDDPTIRKVKSFTNRWGFSELSVVNLWAFRATKPADLWARHANGVDIVGPDNDAAIVQEALRSQAVCVAWGKVWREAGLARIEQVMQLIWERTPHNELLCIRRNGDGTPTHPVMTAYTDRPTTWKVRKAVAA